MNHAQIKKSFVFQFVIALTLLVSLTGKAYAAPQSEIVADAQTGRILHGENIHSLRHPASITKVMTLYLTFLALEQGRLHMNDRLSVSYNASVQQPSRLGLNEGDTITVRNAIYGLVTESANDAAVVLGEAIGGTEDRFAQMMTQQARVLGMKRTVYRNANGLNDDEQVTTAFDQAILARAILYHFPKYYAFFRTRTFTYDGVAHRNHNHLMSRYEGMDGIKTGYVRASGFNLMASAKRDGHRLIAIVFGGRSARARDNRVAEIMDYGFSRVFAEAKSGKKLAGVPLSPSPASPPASPDEIATADASNANPPAEGDSSEAGDTAPVNVADAASDEAPTLAQAKTAKAPKVKQWAVQVGSFTNVKQSHIAIARAKARAPRLLKHAKAKVVHVKNGGKTIYRARLNGLDEKTARLACESILAKAGHCVTLPPG